MSRRILLIEDDPISQEIIRSLLIGQGHEVDVVTDGFSALECARRTRYDAALIDYHLPEMDGYTLGRLLCEQRPREGATPVLIGLTADRNGLAARRGADAVFKAILPKPIKPAELFETLERLCTAAQPGMAAQTGGAAGPAPRDATLSLWRGHGLSLHPRACICPPPTPEQATALALCFELVEPDQAELVLLLERHGINEAIRVSRRASQRLPVVGLSDDHADICDGLFKVAEARSWHEVAVLLGAGRSRSATQIPAEAGVIALPPARAAAEVAADAQVQAAGASGPAEPSTETPAPDLRPILLDGVASPLAALRSAIETQLRRPTEAAGARDVLTRALACLSGVLLVTETVVDFLKTPTPQDAGMTVFDPAELVENAVTMIRDVAPAAAPRLAWRIDASVPGHVRGDAHRLSQILLTMLDDAAHMGPGAATLHVGFDDGGHQALGFKLTHQPDAAADTDGRAARDAGVIAQLRAIRSATLRRLIGFVGGDIPAHERQSGPLTGFTLPATRTAAPDGTAGAGTEAAKTDAARVLLVDDGAVGGEMLTLLLTQGGHSVCRVPDVEAAIFAGAGARQDIALVDLAAPGELREAALRALRALRQAHAAMPVLVIGSGLSDQERDSLAAMGRTTILAKPFPPEALAGAIGEALGEAAQAAPEPAERRPVLDHGVHGALVAALGQASVERLTRQLIDEIAMLADSSGFDSRRAGRLAELASCAAMLGLTELTRSCSAVGRDGRDPAAACAGIRAGLMRAQAAIAALRLAA